MTEALAAERSERSEGRLGDRSGFYSRSLITRVGTIELRVPRDRAGLFSTELFNAISARSAPWSAPCRRCMFRVSRPARSRR